MPRPARVPTIRAVAAWTVVLPVIVVAALLFFLFSFTAARISENLARAVIDASVQSTQREVRTYLARAVRTSDAFERRIRDGGLSIDDLEAWKDPLAAELASAPDVASVAFGTPDGASVWLLRSPRVPGRFEFGLGRAGVGGAAVSEGNTVELPLDDAGAPVGDPLRVYRYDPRERPWYAAALASPAPVWTPVYKWFEDNAADTAIGTGYTRAVRGRDGSLLGVLVVDITLGGLSDFLRHTPLAERGRLSMVDGSGRLLAASHAGDAEASDEPVRTHTEPIRAYPGIDWTLAAALPESAFLADARAARLRGGMVAAVVALGALGLALAFSHRLARPIVELSGHVRRIGEGDFDSRLSLASAREFRQLSADINAMAAGLAQRMELQQALHVAMEVQQALLPKGRPSIPGLDVAGRTRYCDQTGGDYFDYIDVAPLSESTTMLAVGDVMGHGVAAALLMATARAALRSHVSGGEDLGRLMSRVNALLSQSVRDARFMTMALLLVSPGARLVRWASAGHDPAILYHPGQDRFEELEGGDIPLGIAPDTSYLQYARDGLAPGTLVLLGTDGIWETASPSGELFGKDRLRKFIRANHAADCATLADRLEAQLADFRGKGPVTDDVTFILARLLP